MNKLFKGTMIKLSSRQFLNCVGHGRTFSVSVAKHLESLAHGVQNLAFTLKMS